MLIRFCVKLQIILKDKVAVLILMLFKLFSIKLVGESLGKMMCLWGSLIILGCVLMAIWDCFLLWILRALEFANCIKGLGLRRFRKEFSI